MFKGEFFVTPLGLLKGGSAGGCPLREEGFENETSHIGDVDDVGGGDVGGDVGGGARGDVGGDSDVELGDFESGAAEPGDFAPMISTFRKATTLGVSERSLGDLSAFLRATSNCPMNVSILSEHLIGCERLTDDPIGSELVTDGSESVTELASERLIPRAQYDTWHRITACIMMPRGVTNHMVMPRGVTNGMVMPRGVTNGVVMQYLVAMGGSHEEVEGGQLVAQGIVHHDFTLGVSR